MLNDNSPARTTNTSAKTGDGSNAKEGTRDARRDVRRLRMVFKGQVQGVGFRWTAQRKARKVGCTGWVRNESDGSVSMELQGTSDQIARYFSEFNQSYASYPIQYVIDEKDDIMPVNDEREFSVRFR